MSDAVPAWPMNDRLQGWTARRRFLSLIGLGGIAALGHAPFDAYYLSFPAFALAFALLAVQPTLKQAFWGGWALAFGNFVIGWNWLVEPFLVDPATVWMAPFGVTLLAGAMAFYWAVATLLAHLVKTRLAPTRTAHLLLIAALLTLAEYCRGYWFTGFPWGMVAYVWIETPLAQLLAFIGPHGLNLLTWLAAITLSGWLLTGRGVRGSVGVRR